MDDMIIPVSVEMSSDMLKSGAPRYVVMQLDERLFFIADLVNANGVRCEKPVCEQRWEMLREEEELFISLFGDKGIERLSETPPDHSEVFTNYLDAKAVADALNMSQASSAFTIGDITH